MSTISITRNPDPQILGQLGIEEWPIWEKEVSEFPWNYAAKEICYLLEGDVEVIPDNGAAVRLGAGDLVAFPAGLSCYWNIISPVRKRYRLE